MRSANWFLALIVSAPSAFPQGGPLGPEIRLNTYTTSAQHAPVVAADSSGNVVAVWESAGPDGWGSGIFGQRYADSGAPVGPEFRVNTYVFENQREPAIASDSTGDFVVVWHSLGQDGSGYGIFGQRYAGSGAPVGPEFRVNTFTLNDQRDAAVAMDAGGAFVVVWESGLQDGSGDGIFGQRYSSAGEPLGSEFAVNSFTPGDQDAAAVASDVTGDFVVVWQSEGQDGPPPGRGVFGQRYAGSGVPLGSEFRVNTFTPNNQSYPAVASSWTGEFVVVWTGPGFNYDFFGQRFDSSGAPSGTEFRANTQTDGFQGFGSVALDPSGDFVVVWGGQYGGGGKWDDVFGQRFDSSGAPQGPEFRVNTFTAFYQDRPMVAVSEGSFIVVWQSYGQDGSGWGVYGQRFGAVVPVELIGVRVE